MTDQQLIIHLLHIKRGANPLLYPDIFDQTIEEINKLQRIKEITERALRSEDPINLYKARALEEIAKLLGIELKAPAPETDSNTQITFDDII